MELKGITIAPRLVERVRKNATSDQDAAWVIADAFAVAGFFTDHRLCRHIGYWVRHGRKDEEGAIWVPVDISFEKDYM